MEELNPFLEEDSPELMELRTELESLDRRREYVLELIRQYENPNQLTIETPE